MRKCWFTASPALGTALALAVSGWAFRALPATAAEGRSEPTHDQRIVPEKSHPDRLPDRPSIAPAFSIPVESLGFAAPGPIYLGQRFSLASLDFLGENRLLFTFRVPGLIHRAAHATDDDDAEHYVRALVLALPSGAVEAESVWMLHDRDRYIWALDDGRFLLRDRDEIKVGNDALELKPYLRFPGPVLEVGMDPGQQLLVTDSREPIPPAAKPAGDAPGDKDISGIRPATQADLILRVLRRESGKVVVVSRVHSPVDLPLNADGFLELLPGKENKWAINLNSFAGGSAVLGEVESNCTPSADFVSQQEFRVTTCTHGDMRGTFGMLTDGRTLWEDLPLSSPVWPVYAVSGNGSRFARESLAVSHPVTVFSPLSFDDVKGQVVEVFDAATGKVALTAAASPVFDAGGNVAISPSGRRVAVLNAGAIQVFDLPAPPALPPANGASEASKVKP
jgi:hypothetical protein